MMRSDSNSPGGWRLRRTRRVLATAFLLLAWATCPAQETIGDTELPEIRHLAAALSDPESRDDTLLTLLAAIRLRGYARATATATPGELADRFRADRTWLERLSDRYQRVPIRSPVIDPSAWFLLQELDQFQQVPDLPQSPLGPPLDDLLNQLFDTGNARVAAAVLPEVMSRIEVDAAVRWRDLRAAASRDAGLSAALAGLSEEWFEPWMAAEPPAPAALPNDLTAVEHATDFLQRIVAMTLQAGPPDPLLLKRLRYSLHAAMPGLDGPEKRDAGFLLTLGATFGGLYRGEYLPLTESLLWTASGLLTEAHRASAQPPEPVLEPPVAMVGDAGDIETEPETTVDAAAPYRSPLPRALSDLLPALSSVYSPEFARVDPRINAAMATVFDVMQYFHTGQADSERLRILLSATADNVAQWVLLVPDMSFYFDQPVRRPIGSAIADCIGQIASAEPDAPPQPAADACISGLADASETAIQSAELAGDPDGPFGVEQLERELLLAPWQRINYVLGYLQETVVSTCDLPDAPLPNPLEWSNLVTVLDWFARRAPYRFRNDENRATLRGLRDQGRNLLDALTRQTDCVSGAGSGITDPVFRGLAEYRTALNQLIGGLREAELGFRAERLEPGADVVLRGNAKQSTAYRPEDRVIEPCDEAAVCEMRGTLEASPALLGRFPDAYLLADQLRLGEVEVCYDNVQWVERRAEPVRADDPHVANYFGRLSFDLIGRYREGEDVREVFGDTYVSPDEYHYLFGAATDEVLDDPCPTEWIGTRITTGLGDDRRIRVVPDRLTYLTAARSLPSRIITANWARGQQWRAAFETGQGVRPHDYDGDAGLVERLNQRLQALYQEEQAGLYSALFAQPERGWGRRSDTLYDRVLEVDARKAMIVAYVTLLYPGSMLDSGALRSLLEGRGALLDERILRQFRREGVPASEISSGGTDRLERMIGEWNRVPDGVRRSGSVAIGVAHALARLDALERDLFERLLPGEYAPLSFDDLDG
ncbi:MAG: hypothetical protein P8Y52_11875 [Xanthomonadales bacterium]